MAAPAPVNTGVGKWAPRGSGIARAAAAAEAAAEPQRCQAAHLCRRRRCGRSPRPPPAVAERPEQGPSRLFLQRLGGLGIHPPARTCTRRLGRGARAWSERMSASIRRSSSMIPASSYPRSMFHCLRGAAAVAWVSGRQQAGVGAAACAGGGGERRERRRRACSSLIVSPAGGDLPGGLKSRCRMWPGGVSSILGGRKLAGSWRAVNPALDRS